MNPIGKGEYPALEAYLAASTVKHKRTKNDDVRNSISKAKMDAFLKKMSNKNKKKLEEVYADLIKEGFTEGEAAREIVNMIVFKNLRGGAKRATRHTRRASRKARRDSRKGTRRSLRN